MRYDLAAACYDVDRPRGPSPVRRSYMLCSNPRSGSSLLAEALHATGCLGTPIEYFDRTGAMADLLERWDCPDVTAYIDCLHRRRTTVGGVFGAKLHWYQLRDLATDLDRPPLPGPYGRERAAVATVFPRCRFVRVTRRDRDRQAVSWAVAEATGRWGDFGAGGAGSGGAAGANSGGVHGDAVHETAYDFSAIDACRRRLDEAEAAWTGFFDCTGITPFEVAYEDLTDRYAATVSAVARRLGADIDAADVTAPRLRRQADGHSERLLARYRRERASRC